MKYIYIPVFRASPIYATFAESTQNPGIGGTQFVGIHLALRLARLRPDYVVCVVTLDSELRLQLETSNLEQIKVQSIDELLEKSVLKNRDSVLIAPRAVMRKATASLLAAAADRTIAWSHHPFDLNWPLGSVDFAAHVCVGSYQYYSNEGFCTPIWAIPNLFIRPPDPRKSPATLPKTKDSSLHIVHLGALVPAKGFLDIAKNWQFIRDVHPNVKMSVIGSAATYSGGGVEHDLVPAGRHFAQKIIEYIGIEDIENRQVVFLGNMGVEKFDVIKQAHVAVLNPTGHSEAFPASPLECMATGVPVIASDDYGMSDSMRYFPELSVKDPSEIADKLRYLIADEDRYRELQERALLVGQVFERHNAHTMQRWIRLIESVADSGRSVESQVPPIAGFYGSRSTLLYRKFRLKLRRQLKGS